MGRTPKGKVKVESFKGRLRLCWSWQGRRFFLYVGLPDTQINRKAAAGTANQIELDIASNNFDPSLIKYKPERQKAISVLELYDKFLAWKKPRIATGTLTKYEGLRSHLALYFVKKSAMLSDRDAEKFKDYLVERLELITVRERLVMISACWDWGVKKKLVLENPWKEVKVSVPPKQRPQPFTREEIEKIVRKFRSDPRYSHYADYVEFKFGTGLRTGEVAALTWEHCSPGCDRVWVGESVRNGDRKAEKRNKARTIPLTPRLQQLLIKQRNPESKPRDPIFTSADGKLIDAKNFCRRYWKPALEELGIPYRRPYTTRHTLISHGLESGMNPVSLAELTGHDVRTLYESYAGLVNQPQLPDLLPSDPVCESDFRGEKLDSH